MLLALPVTDWQADMMLSRDELVELTGRRAKNAQIRALRFMGIEHKIRPDGSVAVLRAHVESVMSGGMLLSQSKEMEPNWGAM